MNAAVATMSMVDVLLAHRYASHVFAITGDRLHFFSEIFFFINSLLSVLPRHLREATWKHFHGIR